MSPTGALLEIDGRTGADGGQLLRTALSLSLATQRGFRLRGLSAGRPKAGLLRRHLAVLEAAARIGEAEVTGDEIGSQEVTFRPRRLCAGEYAFALGVGASATLLVQTLVPPLLLASGPSRLVVEGGTHGLGGPPYEYLVRAWLPLLARVGARVEVSLERRGFAPTGGGRVVATVDPWRAGEPLHLEERGELLARRARVLTQDLNPTIASREEARLHKLLPAGTWTVESEAVKDGEGQGNVILLEVEAAHVTEVFAGFGRHEVAAEAVASSVVQDLRAWLAADVPAGPHLAEHLLVPLALGPGGTLLTMPLTRHAERTIDLIRRFLPSRVPTVEPQGAAVLLRFPPRPGGWHAGPAGGTS